MEKQQFEVTDLRNWFIAYMNAQQFWLGLAPFFDMNSAEQRQCITFRETYVLHTHDIAQQQGPGKMGFMRMINCTPIADFVGNVPMVVKFTALTCCADLDKSDQDAVRRHIDNRLQENVRMRAAKAGIAFK